MSGLAWRLAFSAGWGRAVLLAGCTAVVSGLLLVAVAVLSLPPRPAESLFPLVLETGLRPGYVFGIALLTLAPLLLLHQAVRLGTAARERRLASLRLAGATPGDVRRVGAVEVGVPAFLGAVAGIGVYWLLRLVLGGEAGYEVLEAGGMSRDSLRLVPTSVTPAPSLVAAVVLGVTLLGVSVGWFASRHVVVTPLGVVRRATARPPRPWWLLLVPVGMALALTEGRVVGLGGLDELAVFGGLSLVVLGAVLVVPWVAYRVGRLVASRARTAPVLVAARRLATEPRAAGRAASAVGAIGLAAGVVGVLLAELLPREHVDAFHFIAAGLVAGTLLVALLAVVGALAVHSVESLLERKRSSAALVALGVERDLLVSAMRWEAGLVAGPVAVGAAVVGVVGFGGLLAPTSDPGWRVTLVVVMVAVGVLLAALVLAAVFLMSWLVRPWVLRATDLAHLRTG